MIFKTKSASKNDSILVQKFSALGDKTRFRLLSLLSKKEELCVSELAEEVGISNAGVSQQLKVLEQAGLIERNRMGQKICYTVREDEDLNKKVLKLINL